jgi:hypothetical protein
MHETIGSKVTTIVFFLLQGKESQPNIQRTSLSTRQILYAKGRGLRWFGSDCISGQGVSRYARGDVTQSDLSLSKATRPDGHPRQTILLHTAVR